MITFLELGLHGRITNQLFQYAALKSVGLYNNYKVKIPDVSQRTSQGQSNRLHYFNISCETLTAEDAHSIKHWYEEPHSHEYIYHEETYNVKDFTSLKGYFQHPKYLERYRSEILKECSLKQPYLDIAIGKMDVLRRSYPRHELVCLSVRRGDAVTHLSKAFPTDADYVAYVNATKRYFTNPKFLVFSGGNEGNTTDPGIYEWCHNTFRGDEYVFIEHNEDIIDLGMMSLCDHCVLTMYASSFGYWASLLNQSPRKICIAKENAYKNTIPPKLTDWIYL